MRASRGQNMVLGALTMLVIALGVFLTLAISVRIHERQELQIAADAAAYSQAVATARAFNSVSAENRVLVAQLASIAAAQSILSWVGFYHGTLNQARDALWDIQRQSACGGTMFNDAVARIMAEDRRLIEIWEKPGCGYGGRMGYDNLSAEYIRTDLYETALDIADNQRQLYRDMTQQLPQIADEIALQASASDPFAATGEEFRVHAGSRVTRRERQSAVEELQRRPIDMLRATMATRGQDPFVSSREANHRSGGLSGGDFIAARLQLVIGDTSPLRVRVSDFGTSYFGDDGPQYLWPGERDGYDGLMLRGVQWLKWKRVDTQEDLLAWGAWAQDSGRFWFEWVSPPPGCNIPTATEDSFGYLVTTGPNDRRDNHMWRRGNIGFGDYREWNDPAHVLPACWPSPRHTFRRVPPFAASPLAIWPVYTDFDADRLDDGRTSQEDAFGQPKTMVAMRRDYAARRRLPNERDPWELSFNFGFSPAGQRLDLTSDREERASRRGFEHAVALASGFVYYHRKSHFREPPNFLNPFWRATLTASDVDERYAARGADALRTLRDFGESSAASTLDQLMRTNFEAVP
ncbi:MAG: hypothetical protein JNK82_44735 [Myxococcaceae bacterium]|nr:hypothetical protein [Myxococcaceae bacterium]